jgi:hypothetical protein
VPEQAEDQDESHERVKNFALSTYKTKRIHIHDNKKAGRYVRSSDIRGALVSNALNDSHNGLINVYIYTGPDNSFRIENIADDGAKKDAENIKNDWTNIGTDMQWAIRKLGLSDE